MTELDDKQILEMIKFEKDIYKDVQKLIHTHLQNVRIEKVLIGYALLHVINKELEEHLDTILKFPDPAKEKAKDYIKSTYGFISLQGTKGKCKVCGGECDGIYCGCEDEPLEKNR